MGVRCFLGLRLPEDYQKGLEAISNDWRSRLQSKMSWTQKGNWHLTLFFLGDISQDSLNEIADRLETIQSRSFDFQAGGAGFFPPFKTPRIVWVGVLRDTEALQSLALSIEQLLLPLDFPPLRKPFQAHLTLARIKEARKDDWNTFQADLKKRRWPRFTVDNFVLWRSRLTPQGPVYTPIQEYPLK